MECRRRSGKRRMGHFSEAVRPPVHDFAALWGLRGTKENNNWQWEAPYRPPERDTRDQLPPWLVDLDQSMVSNPNHQYLESDNAINPALQSNVVDDLEWFRDRIHSETTPTEFADICGIFCQTFRQSLSLGQVSTAAIAESISEVPRLIRSNTVSKDMEHALCASFYQAIWGGIVACKVLRPAEIELEVLRLLLIDLPRLPVHMSGPLVMDILRSISNEQKNELKEEVYAIGSSLFTFDASAAHPENVSQSTTTANAEYSPPKKVSLNINTMKDIVGALVQTLELFAPEEQARKEICNLVRLSTGYANRVVFCGTRKSVQTLVREGEEFRTTWLKTIARGPFASEDLLVHACTIIEGEYHDNDATITLPRLRLHVLCDMLFEYWANKAPSARMVKAHAAFTTSFLGKRRPHNAMTHLCRVFEEQSIPWHKEVGCVLRMLRRIRGGGSSVYYCLKSLEDAKFYLDAPTLTDEMTALYSTNLRQAVTLYRRYSRERPETCAIPLECFPGLAFAVIHDPSFNPKALFDLLGGFRVWKETRTSNARTRLVEDIAFEYSQVNFITTRVALRNVAWCIRYLRQHHVPISRLTVGVITNLGIEDDIMEKGMVGSSKLRWVLDIVAETEGEAVAHRMGAVVLTALRRERERRTRGYR
ncbi:hypothetical protein V494_01198 [Pseudogymnoascus sp. VKM F-4513 (FW-928)]|nr:hypothetical protein V494_01198 [Pseudogymnoascus sp. VKM F-4513 (FW-928)]